MTGITLLVASEGEASARCLPLRLEPCLRDRAVCHCAHVMNKGFHALAGKVGDLPGEEQAEQEPRNEARNSH